MLKEHIHETARHSIVAEYAYRLQYTSKTSRRRLVEKEMTGRDSNGYTVAATGT